MRKQIGLLSLIAGTVVGSLSSLGAVPIVGNVGMTQDQGSRLVTITYELSEAPGIVTLDIQTNGVSIGAEHIQYLHGDVNQEVGIGEHTITWRPDKSWPGHRVEGATAKVSAWEKSAPPDYLSVNLVDGERNWYTSTNALPEGIDSDRYREDILLMRRICQPNGGKWVMGSPTTGEGWRDANREALHRVTLTNDFWMGVFEVTQKQWVLIKGGDSPAYFQGEFWATRPIEYVSYNQIRGEETKYHYPENPEPGSFIGKLRAKTGIQSFDLPSEMQWEYACRAGTRSALNNGKPVTIAQGKDSAMDQVGRYKHNGGMKKEGGAWVPDQATARVGSYLPNAWGLYDMHGNVWEWCLDWLTENISGLDGQVNTASGAYRVRRGGSWYYDPASCRSANRGCHTPSAPYYSIGFRLVCSEGL